MTTQTQPRLKHADSELIPRILLRGMLALVLTTLAIVTIATLTGREPTSKPPVSTILSERAVLLSGNLDGSATVLDANGAVIAQLGTQEGGFISGITRVLDRERAKHGVPAEGPILVRRMENGRISIFDPSTNWGADLMGFGADNARAFARLLAPTN